MSQESFKGYPCVAVHGLCKATLNLNGVSIVSQEQPGAEQAGFFFLQRLSDIS